MTTVATALNDQIRRIARREVRSGMQTTKKHTARYRRDIAALKRQIASMATAVALLAKGERRSSALVKVGESSDQLRFRADGLKTHRAKLGLSALDYGRLVGVSGLTIYHWESKKAKPRRAQLAKLAAVRGVGKREALKRLAAAK